MAETGIQYQWIVTIRENLDRALPEAFVGADNFWYPVEGRPDIRVAPDVYVALGRPKGHRRSYQQWNEGGVAPQVVFEIWSPSNTLADGVRKHAFYQEHGAQEYYLYNPEDGYLAGWTRQGDRLVEVAEMNGFVSPTLGLRFQTGDEGLRVFHRDGRPFRTVAEIMDGEEAAQAEAQAAQARAEALAAKLRALGIDPDAA